MTNSVDTYIDGIIEQVPTLVENTCRFIPTSRQLTKIVLEFVATYATSKGECYVLQKLCEKFSNKGADQNVKPVTQISATLTSQLETIRKLLKKDTKSLQLDAAPSELVSNLSYKVWLTGGRYGRRYKGSLIS